MSRSGPSSAFGSLPNRWIEGLSRRPSVSTKFATHYESEAQQSDRRAVLRAKFDRDQHQACSDAYISTPMDNVVFRCPRTGLNVQHRLDESEPGDPNSTYEPVVCKACTRLHFINRSTGRLLGEDGT